MNDRRPLSRCRAYVGKHRDDPNRLRNGYDAPNEISGRLVTNGARSLAPTRLRSTLWPPCFLVSFAELPFSRGCFGGTRATIDARDP